MDYANTVLDLIGNTPLVKLDRTLDRTPNDGPNGLSLVGDRLYGASDTSVFSLDSSDGRELWSTLLGGREFLATVKKIIEAPR